MSSVESFPIFLIVLIQLRAYTKWGVYSRVVCAYPLLVSELRFFFIQNAKKHEKMKKREMNLDLDFSSEVL